VRTVVSHVASGWQLIDPDTMLINGVHAESVTREQHLALIDFELTEDDVNEFFDLRVLLRLHRLTDREREVTQLLTGSLTHEIAGRLWITPEALRGHVKAVFAKLGVSSRPNWRRCCPKSR
jgi:DNA-binding CsgD family transcriptional regulator